MIKANVLRYLPCDKFITDILRYYARQVFTITPMPNKMLALGIVAQTTSSYWHIVYNNNLSCVQGQYVNTHAMTIACHSPTVQTNSKCCVNAATQAGNQQLV